MSTERPIETTKFLMPLLGVRLECLDARQGSLTVASGFLRRELGKLYLYTAWHVVTGFDPHDLRIPMELPKRRYLRVALQVSEPRDPGVVVIGGEQSLIVPLYADPTAQEGPLVPLWLQNEQHVPNEFLNRVGIFKPFWHDIVKLELPETLKLSDPQVSDDSWDMPGDIANPTAGDKCFIVGYPYGFSAAMGVKQPTPVVFTRFIASAHIAGARSREFFLDGYGAPGMSGGPVFLERGDRVYLIGIYTGDIYPDHELRTAEKTTALGTVADARMYFWNALNLASAPTKALREDGSPA
jgi:hypothetical protein